MIAQLLAVEETIREIEWGWPESGWGWAGLVPPHFSTVLQMIEGAGAFRVLINYS